MNLLSSLLLLAASAFAAPTTVTFHGHAAFEIHTPKGAVLFVDPWLSNPLNPDAANGANPLAKVAKADYILVTHGHFDHTGDAAALAKTTGARLVANFELGTNMGRLLGYPTGQMGFDTLGGPGGEIKIAGGEVTVDFTPAVHSSGMDTPERAAKGEPVAYGGAPMGFVIKIEGGPTIYDTGDTAYFDEMKDIGRRHKIDLALINIGGHFGMEPEAAADAAAAVHPALVVPMHYKTFPILTQDPATFLALLAKKKLKSQVLQPGESLAFEGTQPVK